MFKITVVIWKGWVRSNCLSAFSLPFFYLNDSASITTWERLLRKLWRLFLDTQKIAPLHQTQSAFRNHLITEQPIFKMCLAGNGTKPFWCFKYFSNVVFGNGLNRSPSAYFHFHDGECLQIQWQFHVRKSRSWGVFCFLLIARVSFVF